MNEAERAQTQTSGPAPFAPPHLAPTSLAPLSISGPPPGGQDQIGGGAGVSKDTAPPSLDRWEILRQTARKASDAQKNRQPLDLDSADRLSSTGGELGEQAGKCAHGFQSAWADRERIQAELEGLAILETDMVEEGRVSVRAVELLDEQTGELRRVQVDGRPLRPDWIAAPSKAAAALGKCGMGAGVHVHPDGTYGEHPYLCTNPLCPVCARKKAARKQAQILPVIEALNRTGHTCVHATLTQWNEPAEGGRPVVVTQAEAAAGVVGTTTGPGWAVSGEALGPALARFRSTLTTLRDGRGSRDWWRGSVAGYVYGIEWTGRRCIGGTVACPGCRYQGEAKAAHRAGDEPPRRRAHAGPFVPRWHVHGHFLLVLRPGVDVATFRRELAGRWTAIDPRAASSAQHVREIHSRRADGHAAADALREVLKYPFKVSELTRAQIAEVLATTKGRRFHLPGGALHACSKVGRLARELASGEIDANAACDALDPVDWELCQVLARELLAQAEVVGPRKVYRPAELADEDGDGLVTVHGAKAAGGAVWVPLCTSEVIDRVLSGELAARERWPLAWIDDLTHGELTDSPADILTQITTWTFHSASGSPLASGADAPEEHDPWVNAKQPANFLSPCPRPPPQSGSG